MPFRTSNPAMRTDVFGPAQTWDDLKAQGRDVPGVDMDAAAEPARVSGEVKTMSYGGTVSKTLFLLAACVVSAVYVWNLVLPFDAQVGAHVVAAEPRAAGPFWQNPGFMTMGGAIGGFIVGLITCFAPRISPFSAPVYALLQGCFLGGVSAMFASRFGVEKDGVVAANYGMILQAMLLTSGILGGMCLLYTTRVLRATPGLTKGIIAATFGVMAVYLVSMVGSMFGFRVPFIHESGPIGIGFSLFVIGLAAFNFILDFHFIEQGVRNKAPRWTEWYGGFTLMVTIVWLYLEILRLLAKLRSQE